MKRKLFWVGVLLGLVVLGIGLARLRLDVAILNLLPGDVPVIQGLKDYQKHFANSRELIITLKGPTAESTETAARLSAESLRAQSNLVARATWQPPWLDHPEQMAELIAYLWLNQAPESLAELTNRLSPGKLAAEIASARDRLATSLSPADLGTLAYDPYGFTRLPQAGSGGSLLFGEGEDWFSADHGIFRIVSVELAKNLTDYHDAAAWIAQIKAVIARAQTAPGWPANVRVRYTGGPAFLTETATSMEHDMRGSAIGTLLVIAALFWWAHRRWLPLVWLLVLLVLIVLGTMAIGGLLLGTLNIVSLGFAAILMGLAVDYALVLYQESQARPALTPVELRRIMAPSIIWSALTTAAAFGLLNFGGLPGLSQLGSLVAIGILLAASVMLFAFLPVAGKSLRQIRKLNAQNSGEVLAGAAADGGQDQQAKPDSQILRASAAAWIATGAVAVFVILALSRGWPRVEHGTEALKLTDCPAQIAVDELQANFNRQGEPLMLLFSGRDEGDVAHSLAEAETVLQRSQSNQLVRNFTLPTALWPRPDRQPGNRLILARLTLDAGHFRTAALEGGFTTNAFGFTDRLFGEWARFARTAGTIWPTNDSCAWLVKRFAARREAGWLALGLLYPGPNRNAESLQAGLAPSLPGVCLTSWPLMGEALASRLGPRLAWLLAAAGLALAACLGMAFRSWREPLLSFLTLLFSGLMLLAIMRLAGWSWNLMNFMALPLLLGTGVDYTIHVQLALRRHGSNPALMRRITGRALLLCAATTATGFGSLAWSSSPGLSSLGKVCATGIGCVFLVTTFLLPVWSALLVSPRGAAGPRVSRPSGFYGAGWWRAGLFLVRRLPAPVLNGLCLALTEIYYRLQSQRRRVVVENLLPACEGNLPAAEQAAHRLFQNFALKLADLWRLESGRPAGKWVTKPEEWDIVRTVYARGKGVLFLTLHLGNWEYGGLLLAESGIKLIVLTQSEPGQGFTALRSASRSHWGIETMVVGEDSFAVLEVIKKLQQGAAVAVSIDRPPERKAVEVELFGRPFRASTAAADLAWASGCALLGVLITPAPEGHRVKVLSEFTYQPDTLRSREGRRQLTQQILHAFEPEIRRYLDQWYNFVPIWPKREPLGQRFFKANTMEEALEHALKILPHGPEFRFLDRLLRMVPGQEGVGEYHVRGDEIYLRGHLPGEPLFPGVLLVEAAAQLAGVVAQNDPKLAPLPGLKLTALRAVKILGTARPGETVRLEARITGRLGMLVQAEVTAFVSANKVMSGELTLSGTEGK